MKLKYLIQITCLLLGVASTAVQAKTNLSGFFNIEKNWESKTQPSFNQHNLNLILSHSLNNFRFFTEIEYRSGAKIEVGETDNNSSNGNSGKELNSDSQGAIAVERAWVDVNFNKYISMRAGIMINDTLYEQNHYPSLVVNIEPPQLVKNIFDGEQEGVKLYGELGYGLRYNTFYSRPSSSAAFPSKGVKLTYTKELGELSFDLAFLKACYQATGVTSQENRTISARGAELNLNWKNLKVWSEIASRNDEDSKMNNRRGFYTIASYAVETEMGDFIPFLTYDKYHASNASFDAIVKSGGGLTFRPEPTVSIKSEWVKTDEYAKDSTTIKEPASNKFTVALVMFFN